MKFYSNLLIVKYQFKKLINIYLGNYDKDKNDKNFFNDLNNSLKIPLNLNKQYSGNKNEYDDDSHERSMTIGEMLEGLENNKN